MEAQKLIEINLFPTSTRKRSIWFLCYIHTNKLRPFIMNTITIGNRLFWRVFLPWHSAKGQAGLRQRCRLCRVFCCHSTQQRFRHRQLAVPYLFFFFAESLPSTRQKFYRVSGKKHSVTLVTVWPMPRAAHDRPFAECNRSFAECL